LTVRPAIERWGDALIFQHIGQPFARPLTKAAIQDAGLVLATPDCLATESKNMTPSGFLTLGDEKLRPVLAPKFDFIARVVWRVHEAAVADGTRSRAVISDNSTGAI